MAAIGIHRARRTPGFLAAAASVLATAAFEVMVLLFFLGVVAGASPPPALRRSGGASVTLSIGNAAHGKVSWLLGHGRLCGFPHCTVYLTFFYHKICALIADKKTVGKILAFSSPLFPAQKNEVS